MYVIIIKFITHILKLLYLKYKQRSLKKIHWAIKMYKISYRIPNLMKKIMKLKLFKQSLVILITNY